MQINLIPMPASRQRPPALQLAYKRQPISSIPTTSRSASGMVGNVRQRPGWWDSDDRRGGWSSRRDDSHPCSAENHAARQADLAGRPEHARLVAELTATFPDGDSNFTISNAEEKALGLFTVNPDLIDGAIGFGTHTSPDFWVDGALHEITYAMGRVIGSASDPTVFDLYPLCGDRAVRMDERAAGLFFDRRRRDGACQFRFDF
jgi:hypothetical protein